MKYPYEKNENVVLTQWGRDYVEGGAVDGAIRVPEIYGRIIDKGGDEFWLVALPIERCRVTDGRPANVWSLTDGEIEPLEPREIEVKQRAETKTDPFSYMGDWTKYGGIDLPQTQIVMAVDHVNQFGFSNAMTETIMDRARATFAQLGPGDVEIVNSRIDEDEGVMLVTCQFQPRTQEYATTYHLDYVDAALNPFELVHFDAQEATAVVRENVVRGTLSGIFQERMQQMAEVERPPAARIVRGVETQRQQETEPERQLTTQEVT